MTFIAEGFGLVLVLLKIILFIILLHNQVLCQEEIPTLPMHEALSMNRTETGNRPWMAGDTFTDDIFTCLFSNIDYDKHE